MGIRVAKFPFFILTEIFNWGAILQKDCRRDNRIEHDFNKLLELVILEKEDQNWHLLFLIWDKHSILLLIMNLTQLNTLSILKFFHSKASGFVKCLRFGYQIFLKRLTFCKFKIALLRNILLSRRCMSKFCRIKANSKVQKRIQMR